MKRDDVELDLLGQNSLSGTGECVNTQPAPKHNRSTPIMPTHTYPPDSSDPQDPEAHYNKSGTFPQAKFIWYAEWFLGMKLELELAAAGGDTNAEAVLHAARYFQNAIDQYNEPDREGEEPDYGN